MDARVGLGGSGRAGSIGGLGLSSLPQMTAPDVRAPDFWEQRYQEGRTGWDQGGPTPEFVAYLEGPQAPASGKILVVGCGKGHDVLLFARHGFDALGVDFAPSAVDIGTEAAKEAGLSDRAQFEQADIFDLPARYPE